MTPNTILVRYIGLKLKCTDSFPGGTVHTWFGAGDVQTLPASALPKVQKHPTVWELVPRESLGLADAKAPEQTEQESKPEGKALTDMDLAELRAYAAEHSIKLDGRIKSAGAALAAIQAHEAKA